MYPIFITDDPNEETPINALPGQKRWGVDKLEGVSPSRPIIDKLGRHVLGRTRDARCWL